MQSLLKEIDRGENSQERERCENVPRCFRVLLTFRESTIKKLFILREGKRRRDITAACKRVLVLR